MSSSTFRQIDGNRKKPGTRDAAPATFDCGVTGILENTTASLGSNLAKLQTQMETLRAQVRQAQQLAGLGTAAATIAHEVNNLLTPVLSYAKIALDTDDLALTRKALDVTIKNIQTLVHMSERVLGIAAARVHTNESVSIQSTAQEASEALCRELSKDGIRFNIVADERSIAQVDPLQLRQVFFNLFLNARQAMKGSRSGKLTVEARRLDDQVHISVKDNGPGIDPALLARMFEPLQTTKTDPTGSSKRCSGLGLALCRDLIEENEGTLTVESVVGEGTTFHIRLPAAHTPENSAV